MNTLYKLVDKLKAELDSNKLINTTTIGDITDIDLDKTTIFPLAHISLGDASITESSLDININVILMDIVDENKESEGGFLGNDNEYDVLNSMLSAGTRLVQGFQRGQGYESGYQMENEAKVEFFTDRFENKLAGVSIDINLSLSNISEVC